MSDQDNSTLAALPRMIRVRQRFPETPSVDIAASLARDLPSLLKPLRPGQSVAIAVGSRGIANLHEIVRQTIALIRQAGGVPFIVPAMGSHGGATAAGQEELLAGYGITAESLGVELRSSMAVRRIGATAGGGDVVCSEAALTADHVLLVNRIKPHTDFGGALGSGLLKMLVVGLGKHAGAAAFHRQASRHGYERVLRESARVLMSFLPLLGGVAVIENQRHQIARIEVVPAAELVRREETLCALARDLMPRLPFPEVDLLIVDWMGKNISGTGMDPTVIGRMIHGYSLADDDPPQRPWVRRLFVRDLTPESHGNAIGIGLADFTTARLVRTMDRKVTMTNALTALSLQGAKVPLYFECDREAIAAARGTLADDDPQELRVARIRDTLHLEELAISERLWREHGGTGGLEAIGTLAVVRFDAAGNLRD